MGQEPWSGRLRLGRLSAQIDLHPVVQEGGAEAAAWSAGRGEIVIHAFVPLEQVAAEYLYPPRYLRARGRAGLRLCQVMRRALQDTGRGGLGRLRGEVAMHNVLLRPRRDGLEVVPLRLAEQVFPPPASRAPPDTEADAEAVAHALALIDALAEDFAPEQGAGPATVEAAAAALACEAEPVDLVEALRSSLASLPTARKPPAPSVRRRRGASRRSRR